MMMLYMGAGMMINGPTSSTDIYDLLVYDNGWTMLTAINLMLFALLHNPCATTIMTIYKETKSNKMGNLERGDDLGYGICCDIPYSKYRQVFWLG